MPAFNFVGVYGNGSLYLEMVILSAWRTGKGRVPDCTIVDGAISLMAMVLDFSSAPPAKCGDKDINLVAAVHPEIGSLGNKSLKTKSWSLETL